MTKKSLLNIEAALGVTDADIGDLRKQIDNAERITEDKLNKNYNLRKFTDLKNNETLKQLIDEVKETAKEDFGFILSLMESQDDQFTAFGHKIEPGQSELLAAVGGADVVCIVSLNHCGEDGPRLIMDFGPYIPDTMGELRTNDYLMFPSWLPYGWSCNHSDSTLYTIELYFNIIGTKEMEDQFVMGVKPEPMAETVEEAAELAGVEVLSDED